VRPAVRSTGGSAEFFAEPCPGFFVPGLSKALPWIWFAAVTVEPTRCHGRRLFGKVLPFRRVVWNLSALRFASWFRDDHDNTPELKCVKVLR
jgi:hypothetical protein